jgi:hypothetical protein
MKKRITLFFSALLIFLSGNPLAQEKDTFNRYFEDRTMRLDFYQTGNAVEEHVSFDRIVSDGAWAGSRTRMIDELNRGKYLFEVHDGETHRLLFSAGFADVYGEWETTDEAKQRWRSFSGSLRFPWPQKPVQVVLKKRNAQNLFQETWNLAVDPDSWDVLKADLKTANKVWTIEENGPTYNHIDILFLGDGYTAAEVDKFHGDVKRMTGILFSQEPFLSRRKDFNIRAVYPPSEQSGVHRPPSRIHRRSPLSVQYGAFGTERYALTYDNRTVRDVASVAPYDYLVILMNEKIYGGGGIYNWYATVGVDNKFADYVMVHEFGHLFAGLADEYYTAEVAYETESPILAEPYEPNITALLHPERLKWKDLVTADTPVPTPWEKETFEKKSLEYQKKRRELRAAGVPEEQMESLFRGQREQENQWLKGLKYFGQVGVFEGANYRDHGFYRSMIDCTMFSRNQSGFCQVCRRAIFQVIDWHVQP